MTTLKAWFRGYLPANLHIKASQVRSGAALWLKFVRASIMALILRIVDCGEVVEA